MYRSGTPRERLIIFFTAARHFEHQLIIDLYTIKLRFTRRELRLLKLFAKGLVELSLLFNMLTPDHLALVFLRKFDPREETCLEIHHGEEWVDRCRSPAYHESILLDLF